MPTWFMIDYSEHSTWQCAHFWSHNLQLQYTSIWQLIWDQTTSHLFVYNLELPNKYDHWDFSSRTDGADRSDRTDMIDIFSWHSRTLDVQGSFRNCDVFFMSDSLSIRDGWGYQSRCVFFVDVFSEMFKMAFDPPSPHFRKNILQFLSKKGPL